VIEHHFDVLDAVVSPNRLLQRSHLPMRDTLRVGSVLEQIADPFEIVAVRLAEQHRAQAVLGELSAFYERFERAEVVRLRRMIASSAIVGTAASGNQKSRQTLVKRHARRAIEYRFETRLRLVRFLVEACVWIGACIEQSFGGGEESAAASRIEPQIARKAKV